MTAIRLRYLSRADVLAAGAGDWRQAVADVRAATILMHEGEAGMVGESVLPLGADPREKAYALPAWVGGMFDAAGLKWAVHRAAPSGDVPSITNITFLNRLSDGRPLGLVESAHLTRMRTAAVSAVTIETLLARPPRQVAILGAGAQAAAHLDMLAALFPSVGTIRVWNRGHARRDALLACFPARAGLSVSAGSTPADAIEGADLVLCCTSAPEPLVGASAVRKRRLIVQVGYNEVAFEAIEASDRVVVDLWGDFAETSAKSLFRMYREGRFPPERVAADLPALVARGWRPPAGASVYFSSFGLNVFDIALASRVLKEAERQGLGTVLPFL